MNKSIEQQVKDIESKKRLKKLAGLQSENTEESPEKKWEDLQVEMKNMLDLVKEFKNNE